MKKILLPLALIALLTSCAQTSNGVYSGIYTSWTDRDPISRVDNSVVATKTGKACVTNVLSIVVTGDSSIEAAKKDGGISKVSYVDRTYEGFWLYIPFFQKGCTIVKGS